MDVIYDYRQTKQSPPGSLTYAGVYVCVFMVMPVQHVHVCFISQCQRKSVVCPSTLDWHRGSVGWQL